MNRSRSICLRKVSGSNWMALSFSSLWWRFRVTHVGTPPSPHTVVAQVKEDNGKTGIKCVNKAEIMHHMEVVDEQCCSRSQAEH